jgi:hypothetical protein
MKLKSLLSGFIALCTLAACNGAGEAESTASSILSTRAPSYWKSYQFPISLKLDSRFTNDEVDAITEVAEKWEAVSKNFFSIHTSLRSSKGDYSNLEQYNDSEMGIYRNDIPSVGMPTYALAVTQIYGMKRLVGTMEEHVEILQADIVLNSASWDINVGGFLGFDLGTVMIHELGHFLGLYHEKCTDSTPNCSVMVPSIASNDLFTDITTLDSQNIQDKYGPATSPANTRVPTSPRDEEVKIVIELYPHGECVHKENNSVVHIHNIKW